MIYKLFVCSLLISAISCFTEEQYELSFTQWMQTHQKSYTSEDFQFRFNAFKGNKDHVEACNNNPEHTFKCALNQFSDLPHEEFVKLYTGFKAPENLELSQRRFAELDANVSVGDGGDIINWAARGAVTAPKDQGQCGSCWSFSVTGALEGLNHIYTNNLISLSEQNLMDCSQRYGTNGCGGGDPRGAFRYVIDNHGIDREANYPYQGSMGACRFNAAWTGASLGNIYGINSGDENDLINHLNSQPIAITVDVTQNFQNYHSGILNDPSCGSGISQLDHAILAIGYGSNYYIVKNSWGLGWGMGGYLWMARGSNQCGIATYATAPLA